MTLYLAGTRSEHDLLRAWLKESGIALVNDVALADAVGVMAFGSWWDLADVVADINVARRLGKPWVLIDLRLRDLFRNHSFKPRTRRRVTLPTRGDQ